METKEVKFHFIKAPDYKEFSPNGMFGGHCPNGDICVALYSERLPIPEEIVYAIDGNILGQEIKEKRVGKVDYVRIVQAVIQLDLSVAKSFVEWLQERINESENAGR
ncbi:MAG: hypothetical protein L0Y60_03145 [Beijerinckiaceae bacterium]|nr:hypothetical protein [Beijerinckiaceae bacterium]